MFTVIGGNPFTTVYTEFALPQACIHGEEHGEGFALFFTTEWLGVSRRRTRANEVIGIQ